jgi:tetratricopeptide (TPR) repeat protein
MNEFEAALEDFSKAISLNPSNADLYVRRARVLTKDKRHEAALQDLLLASDFNALNYRIPYYTGKVYADLAQYGNAISQFTRAIELREGYNEAYAARAEARLGLGDVVEARKDYDIAVENTNYRPERMLVKRAAFFYSQQQYEEAMVDYRLAREKNPRHAVAWLGETRAAMKLDDPISALYAINEYLKLKPKSEEALAIQSKLAGG